MATIGNLINPDYYQQNNSNVKSATGVLADILYQRSEEERKQQMVIAQEERQRQAEIEKEQRKFERSKTLMDLFNNKPVNNNVERAGSSLSNSEVGAKIVKVPSNAMMSLVGGGFGDVQGNQVASPLESLFTTAASQKDPFQTRMEISGINSDFEPTFKVTDGNEQRKIQREDRISRNAELANATRIRQEFINRPEVKDYVETNTQMRLMDKAFNSWKNGDVKSANAIDQILINTLGRSLDPGATVRESEYARTPQGMSVVNRFDSAWSKLKNGGVLNDAERESLVQAAKIVANERGSTYNNTLSEYESLAGDYGLDSKLISRGMSKHVESGITNQSGNLNTPTADQIKQARSQGYTRYNTDTGEWLK